LLITRVELQNAKSYSDQVIAFAEGTNAICGENGAGKSTLLEAIGFALFDYLPYTQSDFVREGEKSATIAVSFVSNADEREYQVVRRCGSSSDYYVYDPELNARLVAGKADVQAWLQDHLGVEPGTDLTALFRDAVGVPQGLLTAPFLQRPSERKPLFDRLLRVDEYEQVWKELRETLHYLEARLADHRERIAGLESQVQRLPDLREQAKTLRARVAEITARLDNLEDELAQAITRREGLESIQKQLDELAKKTAVLDTRLEDIGKQLAQAQTGVAQAEAAQEIVEASRAGYEAYGEAQAVLSGLEEGRRQRDSLLSEQASLETSLARAQERVDRLEGDVAEIEDAEAQMQALRPDVERQTTWEAELKAAQEQSHALDLAQSQATDRQRQFDDLQARLAVVESGLDQAAQLEAELGDARARLEDGRRRLGECQSERAALATEVKRLDDQTQTLQASADTPDARAALCPVCEQPLTPEHRAELLARNQEQLADLKAHDEALTREISGLSQESSALERQIEDLDRKLRRLPRRADKEELLTQISSLKDELSALQARIETLSGSYDEAARLERNLAGLADPRRQYERLADKVAQRADLGERLEAESHAVGALQASLGEIVQALAAFTNLDRRLSEGRATLDRYETDYRRHLENAALAADLPARRTWAESLRQDQAELAAERDAVQAQAREVASHFDAHDLDAARQCEAGLRAEQARLQGELEGREQQASQVAREIDELEIAEQELMDEQAGQAWDQHLSNVTEFIRDVIRQAGPHVTRRLMQQVSLEAARLFADLMTDHTARLRWEDNYEIVLDKNGRDRSFQQLSGGEQMAAALSVRLALLRELSAIDIAFFDEPTSNLDDTRRDSLAEQILSVKGFSQLFVISHDDTFERVTHHVIRVYKQEGASHVEVQ
jgi:exonuclease SbcC